MRVSVLSNVPARVGARRNSIATLIQPGCDQARRAAASRAGGVSPPSRRQAWLRPAEITTWGGWENSTGMGVTSRKVLPARGWCFFEVGDRRGAGDGQQNGRALEQPRERELRRGDPLLVGDLSQRAAGSGQVTGGHRKPRDEADVLLVGWLRPAAVVLIRAMRNAVVDSVVQTRSVWSLKSAR